VQPNTLRDRRRLYLLARVIVSRYYRRPLTLAAVARALSSSPRELQRAYAQFESSFQEDLYARRMTVAARLLSEQYSIPVADVGRLVGYPSTYFARAFRRRYGLSPALFRKRAQRHAAKASPTRERAGRSPRRPAPTSRAPARRRDRLARPPAG
jgi:AraC-like DNA-binding protein